MRTDFKQFDWISFFNFPDQTLTQLSSSLDSMDGGGELTSVQILDDDCMYLGKSQEYDIDGMEAYCLATNAEGPIQIYRNNDVEFMMEERLEEDEQPDDIYDEYEEDVKHSICDTLVKDCENVCRLCAETVPSGSDMVNIFTSVLSQSLDQINKLLPKQVRTLCCGIIVAWPARLTKNIFAIQ